MIFLQVAGALEAAESISAYKKNREMFCTTTNTHTQFKLIILGNSALTMPEGAVL